MIVDDLDDHLAGRDRLDHFLTDRAQPHAGHEILDDRQRDVGLEQGQTDFAQRLVDVALAERTAPAQAVEDFAETLTETFEHRAGARPRTSFHAKQFRPGGRDALTGGDPLPLSRSCRTGGPKGAWISLECRGF